MINIAYKSKHYNNTEPAKKKVCSATAGSETEISDAAYPKVVFVTSFYDDAD